MLVVVCCVLLRCARTLTLLQSVHSCISAAHGTTAIATTITAVTATSAAAAISAAITVRF
jgi:hypothetical protein